MTRQVTYRLLATGSTDAAGKAKQTARAEGYRIQTVASTRPAGETVPGPRDLAEWIVTLAVRDPGNAMTEGELIAAYGGLPEPPID